MKQIFTYDDLANEIAEVLESEIENKQLHYENFLENVFLDSEENFVWEKVSNKIRHTFVIINESESNVFSIGFIFEDANNPEDAEVGRIEIDFENDTLDVSGDTVGLDYDVEVVQDFMKEVMVLLEFSIEEELSDKNN